VIKRLHHVAVAVESVQEALAFYHDILGLTDITIKTLKDRGLKVALIQAGESEIELLEPIDDDSTVRRFLDKRGSGLHHICFQVDDIEAAMTELKGRGAEFIEPVARPGAVGLVSFMPPSMADGVLVEFAQVLAPHAPGEAETTVGGGTVTPESATGEDVPATPVTTESDVAATAMTVPAAESPSVTATVVEPSRSAASSPATPSPPATPPSATSAP